MPSCHLGSGVRARACLACRPGSMAPFTQAPRAGAQQELLHAARLQRAGAHDAGGRDGADHGRPHPGAARQRSAPPHVSVDTLISASCVQVFTPCTHGPRHMFCRPTHLRTCDSAHRAFTYGSWLHACRVRAGVPDASHKPFEDAVTITGLKDEVEVLKSLQAPKKARRPPRGLAAGQPRTCIAMRTPHAVLHRCGECLWPAPPPATSAALHYDSAVPA